MHYAEVQDFAGRWRPQAFADKPKVSKRHRLATNNGDRGRIRRVKRVDAEREHLTLDQLAAGYGHDGEGWQVPADGIEDAELVEDAPVFRSARAAE